MSKTLKYLFTFSLLLILLVSPAISEETPPAPDEPPSTGTITLEAGKALTKTISTSKLIDKTGLSLTLMSSHKRAPNLFVSKTEMAPTDKNNDFSLKNRNGGSIFLSNEDLKGVEKVYVRFFCTAERKSCEAEFSIDIAKEVEITADGKPHNFEATEMGGISSMFVRMKVPEKTDANRLIIHADAVPIQKGLTPFMDLNVQKHTNDGKSKKSTVLVHEENIERSGWYAGKTVVIYKDTQVFCKDTDFDCTYVLSLKFLPQSQVRIQADLLPDKLEIKRNAYLDGVKKGAYNVYSYTFAKQTKDDLNTVIIDLQAQEGSIKAFIDCDKDPKDYKTFSQQYEIYDIDDRIVLPKEEFTDTCISKGYTIVIFGLETSVYNIRASENQGHDLVLGEGTPVKGQIAQDQHIDYEVFFPFYMTGQLKIQLQTEGKIDFSISKCRTSTECPSIITQNYNPMFGSDSAYTPEQIKFDIKDIEGGKEILLDPKNRCFPLVVQIPGLTNVTEQRCVYKVTLKSTEAKIQDYSLLASYTGNQILYVGKPATGRVGTGESSLYQIFIPYRNLESLTFQLSTLSGKAEIFVSKNSTHPLKSEDATIIHEDAVIFKDKKEDYFLGLFWITVKGVTTSTFTLTATAISSEGDPVDYSTELTPGTPHKGVIDMKKQDLTHFYRFKLDLPTDWKGIVKIVSTTLHGSIYLGVNNNDEVPTAEKDNFRSTNKNGLEIPSDHELFLNKATYFIGVFVDLSDKNSVNLEKIVYSLTYFLITPSKSTPVIESNQQHVTLTSVSSYRDSLNKNRVIYFKIPILEGDHNLFITKQDNTQDLDLYLSTNPETIHPSPKHFTKSTKKASTDYIELTASELFKFKENCPQYLCYVYLSASTTSENQVPFTLSLEKQLAKSLDIIIPTSLVEGEERAIKFPRAGEFAYFVFYPLPGKETSIDIFCPNKNINIYANVQKAIDGKKSSTDFKFPTANEYDHTSIKDEKQLNTGAGHLRIPKSETSDSTVVTIMLTFEDHFRHGTPLGDPTSFSIVAASEIRYIHSGIPYYGNILQGTYQYFMIDVNLEDCKLIVSLESLDDGDSDLLVSVGKDERPTKEKHKLYSSSSVRSEILEIDKKAIYPADSMEGQWVFGVYGQTSGRYTLTVVYEDKKIIQLSTGVSTEWYARSDSKLYFTYYYETQESINIRVDKQSGYLNVYIKTLDANQALSENLPSEDSYTWTIDTDKTHSITINYKNKDFCFNCLYIIAIEIEQGSKFSVLAHAQNEDLAIKNSFRYLEQLQPGESKRYKIAFSDPEKIYLNTHVLEGSVNVYAMNNPMVSKTLHTWTDALNSNKTSNVLELNKLPANEENKPKYELSSDGKEWVPSQRDVFYFYFINQGNEATEFKFSVYSKESTVVLPPNESHEFLFDDDEERAFLFYSPHNGGTISLVMSFCVPADVLPPPPADVLPATPADVPSATPADVPPPTPADVPPPTPGEGLTDIAINEMLKFDVTISAFSEKTTVGTGKKIDVSLSGLKMNPGKGTPHQPIDCAEQKIEWTDRPEEGRYEIVLSSPYEKPVTAKIRVDSSKSRYILIDSNNVRREEIPEGDSKEFEVSLPGAGYWYFGLIACEGDVSVQYGEDSKAEPTRLCNEGPAKELFIKEKIEKAERKYFKINVEGDDLGNKANILMTSAYYSDDKSLLNYEATGDAAKELALTHNYDYKGDDSVLQIAFGVPALKGFDKNDTNTFDMRLCLKEYVVDNGDICAAVNKNQGCKEARISGSIEQVGMITKKFEGVYPGEYQLSILRSVEHKGHTVRSFVFRNVEINLKEPFLSRIWDFTVALFSGVLLILAIYFVYSKIKSGKVDQDTSIRKSPKKKGYGFVGEDDEDGEDNNLRKDN